MMVAEVLEGKELAEIARSLKNTNKKVQLIYAFNGTGKTRLSREFKELIAPKNYDVDGLNELARDKILYYNAFTEDLFYWDNDLELDNEIKLKIQSNSFTDWVFVEQGQEQNIIHHFQRYTSTKLTPKFNAQYSKTINNLDKEEVVNVKAFSEVTFSFAHGNESFDEKIKISKGEESNFIWSVFYSLLDSVIEVLNVVDPSERETNQFNQLEYIFIDDPVSSLDDNHLIQLAVDLAGLITKSKSDLKFIITTHNPLFYNVIFNELKTKTGYILRKQESGLFELEEKKGDSNTSFSYHLYLKKVIEEAIVNGTIEKYHFMLLRNLYEKTSSFLGYQKWSDLLPDDKTTYLNRIIQFTSHSTLSTETVVEPSDPEKNIVKYLLNHLVQNYHFWQGE